MNTNEKMAQMRCCAKQQEKAIDDSIVKEKWKQNQAANNL